MSPCSPARAACRWSSASARSLLDGHVEAMVDGERGAVVLSPGHAQRDALSRCAAPTLAESGEDASATSPHADAQHRRRHARSDVMINVARPEERRRHRRRDLRRRRPDAHRVPVHRRRRFPTRRRSIAPTPRARLGRGPAGDHPHPRRRRRQADQGADRRGAEPVPRPARHPPVARAARGLPRPASRARPRRDARQPEDHAADGDGARARSPPPPRYSTRRSPSSPPRAFAAARPPLGIMVEVPAVAIVPELFAGRVLLHRLERPHPVRHRGGARQRIASPT